MPEESVAPAPAFLDAVADAVRFWEPRRIPYNLILGAVTLGWVFLTWPHFRPALTWRSAELLLVLATLANACYCTAYLVDIPLQSSAFRHPWRRWRPRVWSLGTGFGCLLASYWIADEIYPLIG